MDLHQLGPIKKADLSSVSKMTAIWTLLGLGALYLIAFGGAEPTVGAQGVDVHLSGDSEIYRQTAPPAVSNKDTVDIEDGHRAALWKRLPASPWKRRATVVALAAAACGVVFMVTQCFRAPAPRSKIFTSRRLASGGKAKEDRCEVSMLYGQLASPACFAPLAQQ